MKNVNDEVRPNDEDRRAAQEYNDNPMYGDPFIPEAQGRPDGMTERHLTYLDELRESGETNMFGAVPYLLTSFPDLSLSGRRVRTSPTGWPRSDWSSDEDRGVERRRRVLVARVDRTWCALHEGDRRAWRAAMNEDLTLAEAATRLGRNPELVRTWVASGRLPARMRAGRWFVRARDLDKFMKREPVRRTWSTEAKTRAAQAAGRNQK